MLFKLSKLSSISTTIVVVLVVFNLHILLIKQRNCVFFLTFCLLSDEKLLPLWRKCVLHD